MRQCTLRNILLSLIGIKADIEILYDRLCERQKNACFGVFPMCLRVVAFCVDIHTPLCEHVLINTERIIIHTLLSEHVLIHLHCTQQLHIHTQRVQRVHFIVLPACAGGDEFDSHCSLLKSMR